MELPKEFIDKFICNLITQKTNEKNKSRNIRIAAIFIGNLLENDHISFEGNIPKYLDDFLQENAKEKEVESLIIKINNMMKTLPIKNKTFIDIFDSLHSASEGGVVAKLRPGDPPNLPKNKLTGEE